MTDTQPTKRPSRGAPQAPPDDDDHGGSVAAWTGVGVILFGALVMSLAVVFTSTLLFVIGAVIAVLGVVAGKVLSAMGFGARGHDVDGDDHRVSTAGRAQPPAPGDTPRR